MRYAIMAWMRGVSTALRGMFVANPNDLKQWAEASHPGTEPIIVSLREAVMHMVSLTTAMLLVSTKKPLTKALIENAIENAKGLVVSLEALHGRVST